MYPFLGSLLIFFLLLVLIHVFRRKKITKKIKKMSNEEKCRTLESLITPFGYSYDQCQDVFSSTLHPWQREFGYGQIYDHFAPHFQMIFDSLPVYFDYADKTWLIELWKGQYGINTGGEIGVYKADDIVSGTKRKLEIFKAVSDEELLPMSMKLKYNGPKHKDQLLACFSKPHWWLTAFKMGHFTNPKHLTMEVSITFPNYDMLHAFTDGLGQSALPPDTIYVSGLTVFFTFDSCSTCSYHIFKKMYTVFVQWKNRCFCKLFLTLTKPFCLSMDRVLYLYEYAPFAFKKMFTVHHYKRSSKKSKKQISSKKIR